MSTIKEIADSKITLFIKPKEGFLLSAARDAVTFSLLGLFIYISRDSSWWTLVAGIMFLIFASAKVLSKLSKNSTTFKDKESAIKYIQEQDI